MKIKDFTPVFDKVAQRYDPYTALVYGKIWRYCNWSEMGICSASNEKLAKELGINEKTIRRKKEKLQEDGMIKVVGRHGETDTVSITREVILSMDIETTPDFQSGTSDSESATPDSESNKDSIKDSNNNIKREPSTKEELAASMQEGMKVYQSIKGDVEKHLRITPRWDYKTGKDLYQYLRDKYEDGETVKEFSEWWYNNWRGENGNPPSPKQIMELWPSAFSGDGPTPGKQVRQSDLLDF